MIIAVSTIATTLSIFWVVAIKPNPKADLISRGAGNFKDQNIQMCSSFDLLFGQASFLKVRSHNLSKTSLHTRMYSNLFFCLKLFNILDEQ